MKRIIGRVPDPAKIPHGLMMINVWTDDPNPREGVIRSSSAKRYRNGEDYWHRDGDYTDKLDAGSRIRLELRWVQNRGFSDRTL